MSQSTKESAKALRSFLKKTHGWNARQVSVRCEYFSMGSAVHVTIRDPEVPLAPVKAAASEHCERIARCEMTGEILSGGNTYLHCGYSEEASAARSAPYLEAVKAAAEALGPDGEKTSCLHSISGTAVLLGKGSNGYGLRLWANGTAGMECNTPECAARGVADLVDAQAAAEADEDAETESAYEAKLAADEDAHEEQLDAAEDPAAFDNIETGVGPFPALRLLP